MEPIKFPVKKKKTPEEFQSGYLQRWRKNTRFAFGVGLGVFLVATIALLLFGPHLMPELASAKLWKILVLSGLTGVGGFFMFYENRPKKDEGENTRRILDNIEN